MLRSTKPATVPGRPSPGAFRLTAVLAILAGVYPSLAQAPRGAVIELPAGSTANWAVPAKIEMTVTGGPQTGFGWKGGVNGIGSNAKPERGSPYFSVGVESGATFYRCDTVVGFPSRLGNSPNINRRGGSSFIAVKPTPKGGRKIWICASVGAYRISGSSIAEWEYQIRYYSGDPDSGGGESLVIGTVPNADVFGGEAPSGFKVTPDFLGVANLAGSIGDRLLFRSGYVGNALGTISVLVTNTGTATAEGSLDVHFYYSEDATLSKTTDIPLGSVTVPVISIPPAGTLLVSSDPVRLPAVLPEPPIFFFLAELKPSAAITETNLTDNVVAAYPLLPGLSIELSALKFADARPGRTGAVEVVIKNWGEGSFAGGAVEVDLKIDRYTDRRVLEVPEIPAKGSVTRVLEDYVIPKLLFETVQEADGAEYEVRVDLDPEHALKGVLFLLGTTDSELLKIRGFGIRGKVVTVRSHRPVPEVKVMVHREKSFVGGAAASAVATVETGEDGTYEFVGLPHESYIVVAERENWAFSALDDWVTHRIALLDAFPAEMLVRQGDVTAFDYFGFGKLVLRSAKTEYRGTPYFVASVGHSVDFLIDVDWGSEEPGEVIFTQGSLFEHRFEAKLEPFTVKIDVGDKFYSCEEVMVQAVSADGMESEKLTVPMVIMPKPSWPPVGLIPVSGSDPLFYRSSVAFDVDLFKAVNLTDDTLGDFPGADSLGLDWVPKLELELRNDEIKGQLSTSGGYLGFKIGKLPKLEFAPVLQLEKRFSPGDCSWVAESFSLGVNAEFDPFVNVIYPLPTPWPVFIRGSVKGGLILIGSWSFEGSETPGFQLVAEPKATGRLTLEGGIPFLVSVGGFGELEASLKYELPPNKVTAAGVALQVGLTATLIGMSADTTPLRWEWNLVEPSPRGLSGWPEAWDLAFAPMDRSYLARMTVADPESDRRRDRLSLLGADETQSSTRRAHALVTQGHPESHAALEVVGGDVLLGWVMDDARRPAHQRTLAVTSRRNAAGAWGGPVPIWDDGTADFHPRLAALPDGTVFAAWEDRDAGVRADAAMPELFAAMEISAARWDPAQGRWMNQERLTLNHQFDRSPRLVVADRDHASVVWVSNAGNDLVGSAAAPNDLMLSTWTPEGWTDPVPVARVPFPLVYLDAALGPKGIEVIMALDTDGNLATTADYDLFVVEETAGTWSALRRLTNDDIADQAPQFAETSEGTPSLVWLRGSELSVAPGLDLARRIVGYTAADPALLAQFRVASDGAGRLAVSWAEPSTNLVDLVGLFYDHQTGTWSQPVRMTDDPEVERGHDAALLPGGAWITAYNRVVPPAPGAFLARAAAGGLMGLPQPVPGSEADLVVLEVSPGPDLALAPGSLRATPSNPGPGAVVSLGFAVTNLSAWTVSGSSAVLYRGVPGAGGVEVGRTNLGAVVGGGSIPGEIAWRLPAEAAEIALTLRIETAGAPPDVDPSNNAGSLSLSRADLAVDPMYWVKLDGGRFRVSAEVVNLGAVSSAPATLRFEGPIDAAAGPSVIAVPGLVPGERRVFSIDTVGAHLTGAITVSATLRDLTHQEFDESNHSASVSIHQGATPAIQLTARLAAGGGFEVRFRATAGVVYVLEGSEELTRWVEVKRSTPVSADGLIVDEAPNRGRAKFYRLRSERP